MAKKTPANIKSPDASKLPVELAGIVIGPRITEKAAYSAESNAYVFNVAMKSNKIQIARAIKFLYNVDPIKVTTSVKKPIGKMVRGIMGVQKAEKKAVVFLKKDQKIEIA